MTTSSENRRADTSPWSGEFRDSTMECEFRLANYSTLRRHTWQIGAMCLTALIALNLTDHIYAAGAPNMNWFTIARSVGLLIPATLILAAVARWRFQAIDRLCFVFFMFMVLDSALMIYVFRNDPVMMAARLPLYAMISNIMFSPAAIYRVGLNATAWPGLLTAFWLMTPEPWSTVPAITVILSVAFIFGMSAGSWLIQLRRNEYFRASELQRTNSSLTQYKQELEQAVLAKTMFLSNVSHELRTPLNAIIGFSDMMNTQTHGPIGSPKYREYVTDIQNSGYHLLDLINDILDLNRLEAGKAAMSPEWVAVGEAFGECRKMVLAAHRNIDPARICIREVGDVRISYDRRALHQIVTNLLTNSVKYAGSSATISLDCVTNADGGCQIIVTDDGDGMTEATLSRLMKPFEQADASTARRTDGWGLGLPLANALASANESKLDIQSAPGLGTRVSVRLSPEHVARAEAPRLSRSSDLALSA
jgi:signal transduction histidine kinase